MADEAVVAEPVENIATGSDTGSTAEDTSSQQTEGTESTETTRDTSPAVSDDGTGKFKLGAGAKTALDAIKETNPRLARELRASAFDSAALRKEFPEGIKEAVSLKQEFEALGGREGVQTLRGEVEAWQGLDKDFQNGDPKFVEDIAAGNPDAFLKAAPTVLNKFAELDPDGFSGHIGRIVTSDMQAYDIPLQMRLMARDLFEGGSPQLDGSGRITNVKQGMQSIAEGWAKMAGYIDRMGELAKKTGKKPEGGKADDSQLSEREKNVATAENQSMVRDWIGERTSIERSMVQKEMDKLAAGRKLSSSQIDTIRELYEVTRDRMINADKAGQAKVSRFHGAKDKEGYRRFIRGSYGTIVPRALTAAFNKIVQGKPGPKIVHNATTTKAKSNTPVATDTTGFTRSATKPPNGEVAWHRMSLADRNAGKYLMRDGRKLLFKR